ncbi:MAG: Ig-like domain-containing protein [Nitrospirota bacterium]|nr:Ig-like domain-containing protein [Nitrospirota bacterium]
MKREKLIFVVLFMVCSFAAGTVFAQYELQEPDWCVVDCGLSDTIGTGDYADGLDTGDSIGYRLDSSIGPLGEDDWEPAVPSGTIVESGFYQVNYSTWVENPTFVFNDTEISSTTIKFKLQSDNPDWTQYAIAFSTGVNLSDLFTGTIYYIKKDGSVGTSFSESNDWNPASFYEGIGLTGLNPNTIYGFKIKSRIPPPELLSTDWSGNTDNYTWTHIETPGISVKVYITSATVTAVGQFSNLGAGASGINFGRNGSWAGWTTATSHTFTSLTHNTSYTFSAKARNGRQYETAVVSASKYTLCGPPRNPNITNVTSFSLRLGWSHSSLGAPDHYHIKENEEAIQDDYTQLSLDRASLEYVNFRYTYKIYAVNQANETDEISSVSISAYTSCSIPPGPQILDVSADTSQITIDPGNNPWYSDFSIRVSGAGTTNFVQNDHTIGSGEVFNTAADWESPLTISTLLSNVEYDISVQAKNMSGAVTGYGTSVSSCTYAAVPSLSVEQKGPNSVTITILEGTNSPPTEYAIQGYRFDGIWSYLGWLDTDETFYPSGERWHTKDEWGGGSGFTLSLNLSYGYRFRAKARRTIPGYSKKETGLSANAYVGNVVVTPSANIGVLELNAGTAYYYNTNQTVTFTAIGVDQIHYTYTTNGSDPADPTLSSPGGSPPVAFALTASAGESNTYRIKAKAWQGAVESDAGGVWIVVIDRQPPTINSFSIVEKPYTTSQKITLSIWATDADYMKIEGAVTNAPIWIDYSNSKTVLLTEGAGEKTVSVTVKDEAGNESSPASDSIIYDPTPPNITGFRIKEGDYTDARQNMHLIEIDATAANLMWIDGDVENDSVTKEWIAYGDSAQVTLTSGDGPKTVTIKVANTVGTEAGPVSDTITLDTKPPQNPTLVLSDPDSPNPEYTNYEYVVVSLTNLDTDVVEYILSETQATQPSATATWWPKPIPATYHLSPVDGDKKVYIWVKDVVGHINAGPALDTITLDTTPPENPSLSIDGGPYANSPDVTLQISATDANLRDMWIEEDVTGSNTGKWIPYATAETVTLSAGDGPKIITIKFRDEAGNETLPISYTITLEATPPVIEGDIEASFVQHDNTPLPEATETGCQSPTFIWKATDTLSGIGGYSYSFSPVATVQPTIDITTDSILLQLTTSYADGTYYFKVKAMDNANNFSSVETFVYEYKADSVSPEATIQVEGKERVEDEVKGVKANAVPEIEFTEEVWGAKEYVQVELIRDNEGKEYKDKIVSCEINSITALLWNIDPGKDWDGNYTYKITAKDEVEDNAGNSLKEEKKLTFTTMLDRTKRNVVMWESDPKTKMILEANALNEDGYVLINLEPLPLKGAGAIEAKEVNEEAIIAADEKAKNNADIYCYNLRESMREISGYDTEGGKMVLDKFLNTVYLELPYGDANDDGIVDSTEETSARVRVQTLSIYWLDEEHKLWVKVSGTKVDKEKKVAGARVIGFGTYTLMGGGFYDLADSYAYPVPYKPNDGLSTTGDETSGITFTNLSSDAEIKIYTITGELVKKLVHKTGFVKEWYPVENEKGEKVVSGVYIYYITNKNQHKSGKLVIIR